MGGYGSHSKYISPVMRTWSKPEETDDNSYLYPVITDIDDGCNDDCIDDEEDLDEEDSPRCVDDVLIGHEHESSIPQPQHGSLRTSSRFQEDFSIIREIAKGPVTTVYEVVHRETSEHYAAKIIYRRYLDPSADAAVHAEVDILRELHNSSRCSSLHTLQLSYEPKDGIIDLKKVYIEPNRFVEIIDYVPRGDLLSETLQRKRLPEEEVKHLAFYFLHTLNFLHDHNIVHRDIKPQNLLMKYNEESGYVQLCIADFGLATKLSSAVSVDDFGRRPEMLREKCGTPAYVAPEVLNGTGYDERVDNWAFGAVLYYLLSGTPPFADKIELNEDTMASYNSLTWDGGYHHFGTCSNSYTSFGSVTQNRRALFSKIVRGDYNFCEKDWIGVSEEAKHLVGGLLTVDSTRRITAEEALQHEWFASVRAGKFVDEREAIKEMDEYPSDENIRARTLSDGTVKSSNQRALQKKLAPNLKKKNSSVLYGYFDDRKITKGKKQKKIQWITKKAKKALSCFVQSDTPHYDENHPLNRQEESNSLPNNFTKTNHDSVAGFRGDEAIYSVGRNSLC